MNEDQIKQLWQLSNERLEQSLLLNQKNTVDITRLKVHNLLSSMKPIKIFTIIAGVLWVLLLDTVVVNLFNIAGPFILIAAIAIALLNKIAIGLYLYHLVLIYQLNNGGPVVETQEKLAKLKSSTLLVARILFLQLPFWTIFYWNKSMLENGAIFWWVLQIMITISFTYLSVWLFNNIKYENRDQKWFKFIFNNQEWDPVIKSMDLLEEIKAFKKED